MGSDIKTHTKTVSTITSTRSNSTDHVSLASNTRQDAPQSSTQPESFQPDKRVLYAFASLCILALMVALDATSLSVALAKIASSIHGTAIEAFWSGTSFLLTSTVFQPVIGSFSSIFGRKNLVFVSLTFFAAGAIVAALARANDGMAMMLIGRSIQGVGGGGILVLLEIIVTDLVPLRLRGKYQSIVGAMWAVGSVTGPVLGGVFSEKDAWRWIFWINLPFIVLGAMAIAFLLKLKPLSAEFKTKLRRVDWVGCVLFVGSAVSFLIPLTWGGVMYSWSSWRTLVPLIVGVFGLILFVIWGEKFATEPLIPFRVMKNRSAAVNYLGTFLHGLILWCQLYYGPLYYEACKGYSPIISGVALFPQTFTVAPAAVIVGILVAKTGVYRWAIWAGWTFATIGLCLCTLQDVRTPIPGWIFINIASGLGTGMLFPSPMIALQAATPSKDVPSAVTLFTFFRTFGQAVGVAVGGVIFQNRIKAKIMSHTLIAEHATEWSADASALVEIIKAMPDGAARDQLMESYAGALKNVWAVLCGLAFVGLVTSLLTKHYCLDKPLETDQGVVNEAKVVDEEKRVSQITELSV